MNRSFLIFLVFILCTNISSSQLREIFKNKDTTNSSIMKIGVEDINNIAIETQFYNWSPSIGTWDELGGYILNTKNSGSSWDTIRKWTSKDKISYPMWDSKFMSYFGKDILGIYYKNGRFDRVDLKTNKLDTTQLFSNDILKAGDKVYFNRMNSGTAIISAVSAPSNLITYDSAKSWRVIQKYFDTTNAIINRLTGGSAYVLNDKYDYFQIYGRLIVSSAGYERDLFEMYSVVTDFKQYKWYEMKCNDLGKEAVLMAPLFINDSVGFSTAHKAYFVEDSINPNLFMSKPMILKTTDRGLNWFKVYEADKFYGNIIYSLQKFGDTLMFSYTKNQTFGLIYSPDLGATWKVVDLTHLIVYPIYHVVANVFTDSRNSVVLVSEAVGVPGAYLNAAYHLSLEKYLSAPEEPKVFLPDAKIFPNPAVDYVNIEFEPWLGLPSSVELYDILGNKVSTQIYRSEGSVMINTVAIAAGTYTVRISTPNGVIAKAFVKGL